MTTCLNCESISGVDIRQDLMVGGQQPGQELTDAINARLDELRASGYVWVPEKRAMVKQCADCADSDKETHDETPTATGSDGDASGL